MLTSILKHIIANTVDVSFQPWIGDISKWKVQNLDILNMLMTHEQLYLKADFRI